MKRRLGAVLIGRVSQVPLDTRPIGALKSADSSQSVFAQTIHRNVIATDGLQNASTTFGAHGDGIRTIKACDLKYNNPLWNKLHPREEKF
jgi:hypothetical protein